MTFFQLVRREMESSLNRLAIVSALGGISTTAILSAINAGAQAADNGSISLWSAMLFIIALILFIQTQHYILITTTAEIEAIIHKLRVRLMDYVRRSELLPLEAIGRAEIVGAITRETAVLTQASNTLGICSARRAAHCMRHDLRGLFVVLCLCARRHHRWRWRNVCSTPKLASSPSSSAKRPSGKTSCMSA